MTAEYEVVASDDRQLLRRFRRIGRPCLEPAQIGQAEMQKLGLLLGCERRPLAALQEYRGQRPQRLAVDASAAAIDEINTASRSAPRCAGVEPEQSGFRSPLGEHAEQLFEHARLVR